MEDAVRTEAKSMASCSGVEVHPHEELLRDAQGGEVQPKPQRVRTRARETQH